MKERLLQVLASASLMGLLLAACAPAAPAPVNTAAAATQPVGNSAPTLTSIPTIQPTGPAAATPKLSQPGPGEQPPYVQSSRADLAERLNLPVDQIEVLSVIGSEFSQQSFNCAKPSKERTGKEAPIENIQGFEVLLQAGQARYRYHANSNQVVFCGEVK